MSADTNSSSIHSNSTTELNPKYYEPSARAIAFCFTAITVVLTSIIVVLALVRAKYQPLKARNAYFLIVHTLLYACHLILNTLYVGIGKDVYPCFMHLLTYAFASLCVAVNATKCWRLLFALMASHLKADIHKAVSEEEQRRIKTRLRIVGMLSSQFFFAVGGFVVITVHITIYVLDLTVGPKCDSGQGFWQYFLLLQVLIPVALHILVFVVCGLIMLIGKYEDTWSIRMEMLIMPFYWVPLALLFGVFWWFLVGDTYFPSSIYPWTGAVLDLIICMLIPCLRTFVVQRRSAIHKEQNREKHMSVSMLQTSLQNETLRNAFLQFTTKSFCCENLCFWIDVKIKFETMESEPQKLSFAKYMLQTYLQNYAISELNLDNKLKNQLSKQIAEQIAACEKDHSILPRGLFKDFAVHVELDLMDSFSRFILTPEYWQATEQKKGKLDHLILCCK